MPLPRWCAALLGSLLLLGGCNSDPGAEPASAPPSVDQTTDTPGPATAPIVGVWKRETTCEQRVAALEKAGLGRLAAESVAGDSFIPGASSPADLRDRKRPCLGAIPLTHYHFFSADGQFGSLDQNLQQVDDGPYEVLGQHLIRIGSDGGGVRFKYAVTGNHLRLWPVLPACARVGCFDAGWSVAVSYLGLPWTRAADDLMP